MHYGNPKELSGNNWTNTQPDVCCLGVGDLVSRSSFMQRVFEVLPVIATSPTTVMILGETGTGKGLIARTIHSLSLRSGGPFIAVNCGALPDTLLESELFGYKAGALTGANKDKPGRFAVARGGALFLDEIGDVSPALQVRLLRVLQERTYEPLGATRSETADARIIVASNKDLAEQTREGAFREDRYYRVNVVRVELPPLRRRKEDVTLLAEEFVSRFNRLQKKTIKGIAAEALSVLMAHDWPGNVRELENVIVRSFILRNEGYIGIEHLPEELTAHGASLRSDADLRGARELLEASGPRPSMLTRIPSLSSTPRNCPQLNRTPWSVLKISGCPRSNARRKATTQKSASKVLEVSQAST